MLSLAFFMPYLIALLFVVLLSLSGRLSAADFDDGVQAIKRGDYATAFSEWNSMAEMGHAKAQYNLGAMYAGGLSTSQNNTEAVKWYLLVAKQGYAIVQYNLGLMYHSGLGAPLSTTSALTWYLRAAEQGVVKSQYTLSQMYAKGERIPPNNRIAFMSMSLAKKMRHPEAARSVEMFSLKMTAEQISKGQQIAAKWWERRQ